MTQNLKTEQIRGGRERWNPFQLSSSVMGSGKVPAMIPGRKDGAFSGPMYAKEELQYEGW